MTRSTPAASIHAPPAARIACSRPRDTLDAMKGDKKIIDVLNDVLTAELTAINQYFVHGEMCENWGYERLHHEIRKHSIEEMKHAEQVIERILFLEGIPNMQRLGKVNIGESVAEQFRLDLGLELEAVERLNKGIVICNEIG